jgi:A/G-specific adenine glycosylase
MLTPSESQQFQAFIRFYFQTYGRHSLPWRKTFDPYHILVSEIMLQQTQVDRVIPKFNNFIEKFPSFEKIAKASPAQIITAWQGLGYNRRGLNLQRAAQMVMSNYKGQLPSTHEELLTLPGIGPYTASAIQAFAFNLPSIVIETNIRAVYIYHFFPDHYQVEDQDLFPWIEQTLDVTGPRQWYSALMDYGSYLKSILPNPTRQSRHYVKQSTFSGSFRQLRGQILKFLTQQSLSEKELLELIPQDKDRLSKALANLISEGFIEIREGKYQLSGL